jgi:exodeoxyribonuclease VII small subunit
MPAMSERTKKRKFDEGIVDLEKIVARLESGDLTLEDALSAFESGIALVRELNQRLADAEARVQILTRNAEGELRLRPMDRDDDAES